MSPILDKKQMTEEDIKLNFITPALVDKGWQDKITMETAVRFTDGKISLRGNIGAVDKVLSSETALTFGNYLAPK